MSFSALKHPVPYILGAVALAAIYAPIFYFMVVIWRSGAIN